MMRYGFLETGSWSGWNCFNGWNGSTGMMGVMMCQINPADTGFHRTKTALTKPAGRSLASFKPKANSESGSVLVTRCSISMI